MTEEINMDNINTENTRGFIDIFTDMFKEFIDFIVFMFYGVFRGETE